MAKKKVKGQDSSLLSEIMELDQKLRKDFRLILET